MKREYESADKALATAKEAMWLAWKAAGGPAGYGVMRDKPTATKNDVWDNAYNKGDYCGRGSEDPSYVSGDYVFGRMLKLRFTLTGRTIDYSDSTPTMDYQAWCGTYPTYKALFDAAEDR